MSQKNSERPPRWLMSRLDFFTLIGVMIFLLITGSNFGVEYWKEFRDRVQTALLPPLANQKIVAVKPKSLDSKSSYGTSRAMVFLKSSLTEREFQEKDIRVHRHDLGIKISLDAKEVYTKNEARLKQSALTTLDKVAMFLKRSEHPIYIENLGVFEEINDKDEFWGITSERSNRVAKYLIMNHKMNPDQLITVAHSSANFKKKKKPMERLSFLILNPKN